MPNLVLRFGEMLINLTREQIADVAVGGRESVVVFLDDITEPIAM